ncbi:MAG: ATP-binding protein [Deltaproteobacteria bacterium]|nr:ATP-binding protein [Deltaproteobacteria bacterium]
MDKRMPFSQEDLNEIFKISPIKTDRVISRECGWLEFKESFGWASIANYLRSCAAFANVKGGYIVFGIANRPHILKGLKDKNLEAFEILDPEQMTKHFNDHFAPEIEWDIFQYELNGKAYGLIYVHECKNKPVVCCKDAGKELKEGDIYYRYRGRTERIKYPELRTILEATREQEQKLWMRHLVNIARIGVQDAGIFDLQTGQVTGSGGSFLIDESLLSQLSFIKEGEFSVVKGKPALKLIGNVQPIGSIPLSVGKKQIVKIKGIRIADIVGSFLNREQVSEPKEFIKQICFETSAFLPCYYYMHSAGLDGSMTIKMLNEAVSRSPSKSKLIERITNGAIQKINLPTGDYYTARKKRAFVEQLASKSVNTELSNDDLLCCLQAIRGLSAPEVSTNSAYISELLRTWFNKHYSSAKCNLADHLRRAICWIDEAIYKEGVNTNLPSPVKLKTARRRK